MASNPFLISPDRSIKKLPALSHDIQCKREPDLGRTPWKALPTLLFWSALGSLGVAAGFQCLQTFGTYIDIPQKLLDSGQLLDAAHTFEAFTALLTLAGLAVKRVRARLNNQIEKTLVCQKFYNGRGFRVKERFKAGQDEPFHAWMESSRLHKQPDALEILEDANQDLHRRNLYFNGWNLYDAISAARESAEAPPQGAAKERTQYTLNHCMQLAHGNERIAYLLLDAATQKGSKKATQLLNYYLGLGSGEEARYVKYLDHHINITSQDNGVPKIDIFERVALVETSWAGENQAATKTVTGYFTLRTQIDPTDETIAVSCDRYNTYEEFPSVYSVWLPELPNGGVGEHEMSEEDGYSEPTSPLTTSNEGTPKSRSRSSSVNEEDFRLVQAALDTLDT